MGGGAGTRQIGEAAEVDTIPVTAGRDSWPIGRLLLEALAKQNRARQARSRGGSGHRARYLELAYRVSSRTLVLILSVGLGDGSRSSQIAA